MHELVNQYWRNTPELQKQWPWWLAMTDIGPVIVGWRNRVIAIAWSDTPKRGIVTQDDVTKDETLVHAWSYAKAVEYLAELKRLP